MVWDTLTRHGVEEENETQGRDGVKEREQSRRVQMSDHAAGSKGKGEKKRKQTKTTVEAQANEEG